MSDATAASQPGNVGTGVGPKSAPDGSSKYEPTPPSTIFDGSGQRTRDDWTGGQSPEHRNI